jgi:1,4-alpha-glucan branching enzyme
MQRARFFKDSQRLNLNFHGTGKAKLCGDTAKQPGKSTPTPERNFQNMKHNHNHDNAPDASALLVPVRFEFTDKAAHSVFVAGSFNDWKPEAKALHPDGAGRWWKETPLKPGDYEYCFVVDGQWIPDPQAKETVQNPFGGRNSVLKVTSHEHAVATGSSAK